MHPPHEYEEPIYQTTDPENTFIEDMVAHILNKAERLDKVLKEIKGCLNAQLEGEVTLSVHQEPRDKNG